MSHYCTYFDRGYLAQGLAMADSLAQYDPSAVLWVLALDDDTATFFRKRPNARRHVLELEALLAADPELALVRTSRPRGEFYFTLTPCLTRHLLRSHPEIGAIVYLDADLLFFASPAPVWMELGDSSVLIAAHRYPRWHDDSALYGKYNVGVLAFRDDPNGRSCLDWWRERCLESCALSADGVHYGDQKYLDEWPQRFSGVVELKYPGINLAPWNWAGHRLALTPTSLEVDGSPLVVFHFAQFRRVSGRWFDSGQLEYGIMPFRVRSRVYGAYWLALSRAEAEVREVLPDFQIARRGWRASLGPWHLALLRLFWGQFWLRLGSSWISGRFGLGRFSGKFMGAYRRRRRSHP